MASIEMGEVNNENSSRGSKGFYDDLSDDDHSDDDEEMNGVRGDGVTIISSSSSSSYSYQSHHYHHYHYNFRP